ncbi:MAG: HDIG domain-containing protein [Deltaproteobacteria bacterium]|nr:HDIG domain-containing protein [Deltaproteobacteria bacterium]
MNAEALLARHCPLEREHFAVLLAHSRAVARLAEGLARSLSLSPEAVAFVREAALLHDIGIHATAAPFLGCRGDQPYYRHGILGRKILESEGLPAHALVCERHIGCGITAKDVAERGLLLPRRDMVPVTTEEALVAFADKFFSKDGPAPAMKHSAAVAAEMAALGPDKAETFASWLARFGDPSAP